VEVNKPLQRESKYNKEGKNLPIGTIIKGIGGFYYIGTDNGLYECRARGVFRNNEIVPLPGDKVLISIIDENNKKGNLEEILKRNNNLIRPAVANIDQIIIVISVNSPKIDYYLLDKLLITAESKKIKPVICVNKIDLDLNEEHLKIANTYRKIGYSVFSTSSKLKVGFDNLRTVLKDNITVFAGQSGVGKSTILNNLLDSIVMETGKVSEKIKRGKHTTRHAELIELNEGGYIVDTPGFSSFLLENISFIDLEYYYPEFNEQKGYCKFNACSHIKEPGCRVKNAFAEGFIDKGRYTRYISLYEELKNEKEFEIKRRRKTRR
jgi:ribosome biogenesis GTPase